MQILYIDEQGNPFRFEDGDGPPRYSILNFQQNGDSFGWEIVGNYSCKYPLLKYN